MHTAHKTKTNKQITTIYQYNAVIVPNKGNDSFVANDDEYFSTATYNNMWYHAMWFNSILASLQFDWLSWTPSILTSGLIWTVTERVLRWFLDGWVWRSCSCGALIVIFKGHLGRQMSWDICGYDPYITTRVHLGDGPSVSKSMKSLCHDVVLRKLVEITFLEESLPPRKLGLVVIHGIGNINLTLRYSWVFR